jgi:ATP-dependent DNA ligase
LLLNEHFDESGDVVFRWVCELGLEGIVSKPWLDLPAPGAHGTGSRAKIRRQRR